MSEPLFSVVIPTYKRPIELNRALQSVFSQTNDSYEVIIVDDNEPDSDDRQETQLVINGYSNHSITYIKNKKNMGGSQSRNIAIKYARGKFIAFLDDDDTWHTHKLEKQAEILKKHQYNEDLAIDTGFSIICKSGKKRFIKPRIQGNIYNKVLSKSKGRLPKLSSLVCSKSVLIKVGLFDASLPSKQDYELYIRLFKHVKLINLKESYVINYRDKNDRISINHEKKVQAFQMVYKKHFKEIAKYRHIHSEYMRKFAIAYLFNKNENKARECIKKSLLLWPFNIRSLLTIVTNFRRYTRLKGYQNGS